MSSHHVRQSSTTKVNPDDDDVFYTHQDDPSRFDLIPNSGTNETFRSSAPKGNSLLDPEAFRRLSISTVSSIGPGRARSLSPYPLQITNQSSTWRTSFHNFWQQNQGLFYVTFSQVFGALMNVTTRLLELEGQGMHPFQILFARQGITTILCTLWMWRTRVPDFPFGKPEVRSLLCIRAFTGFFGIYGMYYSLQYLPVADAVVITFLAPSVASYGCYIFLREPFPRSAQLASLISLLGVVLIAHPTSFFSSSSPSPAPMVPEYDIANSTTASGTEITSEYPIPTATQRLSAIGLALVGVLGAAGAFTSIRWVGSRAHPLLSVNYFSIFCTIISLLALTLTPALFPSSDLHFALPANLRQWSQLIFLGMCGFVMQFLLTKGLVAGSRGNGARATNMIYTNMLFALCLDRWVFGVVPGWWSLAGSGLILGSAVFVAVKKQGVEGERGGEERDVGVGSAEEMMGMLSTEQEDGMRLRENVDTSR